MKLSISNIGWMLDNDARVYALMKKYGYTGLEIAPTRIIPESPYDKIEEAQKWKQDLYEQYGFCVSSMQSIWYGRQERLFGSKMEKQILIDYTKRAIDFAAGIGCKNLVFGCPRNRSVSKGMNSNGAISFFKELGDYAAAKGTAIGMEANPTIYNTNYINDTLSAFKLIGQVNSKGFKINLDVGTIIQNQEDISELLGKVKFINHVHISEPGLKPIKERRLHDEVRDILKEEDYQGFVSIEMGKVDNISVLEEKMRYIKEVFCGL